jgi:mRNA (guanine-N7-)-methyltransferase
MSRQIGLLYSTKIYHNNVKLSLYEMFTKQGDHLIDIGCGKGGDLHKWERRRLRSVLAVDISGPYISEAKRRHSEKRAMRTHVTFLQTDAFSEAASIDDGSTYDAMSCMFCLHYAACDEASIHRAFKNASTLLKTGGVFFGVCADGDVIEKGGNVANDIVHITLDNSNDSQWGCAYEFTLCDSIVSENNREYITRQSDLIQVAAQYNIAPMPLKDCAQWKTREGHAFANLIGTDEQTDEEKQVSAMYFVYAFVKL